MSKDFQLQQITQELKQIWGEKLYCQNDKLLHILVKKLIDTDKANEQSFQNMKQDLIYANNTLQNCFRTVIFERHSEVLDKLPEDKIGKTSINKKKSQDLINEAFLNDLVNSKNQPQLQEELYRFLVDYSFAVLRIQRILNQPNKQTQQIQGIGQAGEQWQQQQQQQQQQYGYYQQNPSASMNRQQQQQQQMPYQQDQQYFNQNLIDPSDPSLNQQQFSSYQGNGTNPYSYANSGNTYQNVDSIQEPGFSRADSNYNDGIFGNDADGVDPSKNNLGYRTDNTYLDPYDNFNNDTGLGNNEFGGAGQTNNLLNGSSRQGDYYSNIDQQFLPPDQFLGVDYNKTDDLGDIYDSYPADPYSQPQNQQQNQQQMQVQINQPLQSQPLQNNQRYMPQQGQPPQQQQFNQNYQNNPPPAGYLPQGVPVNAPQNPPNMPQSQHDNYNQINSLQSSGVYGPQNNQINQRSPNMTGAPLQDMQQIPQPINNDYTQQQHSAQPGYIQQKNSNQIAGSNSNLDQQAYFQQQQQYKGIPPINNSMNQMNPQQISQLKHQQLQQNTPMQPQIPPNQPRPLAQQPQPIGGLSSSQQQQNTSLHNSLVGNRAQPQQQNSQQIQQQQQPSLFKLPNQEIDTPQPQPDYNQAVPLNGSVHATMNYQQAPNNQHQGVPNQFNAQQQGINGLQAYQSLNESNHSLAKGGNSNHGSQHRSSNNKQMQPPQQAGGSPYNPQNIPYQQNPAQPIQGNNQGLSSSSQFANQQGKFPPQNINPVQPQNGPIYPNQAGQLQGNQNMQQPPYKGPNLNSSLERMNLRPQEDGLKNSYHQGNPQYNNPQNFQQGIPVQKGGNPNNIQSSNDLKSSYQQSFNQLPGQTQPPNIAQQSYNSNKIDPQNPGNQKGQINPNPQMINKGMIKQDGSNPAQFNSGGIAAPTPTPMNYQPGQPIPQQMEQQIPPQTIPTTQPGSKANQAKLALQQHQQQQIVGNGGYNQANQQQQQPPGVQTNQKRMSQPIQGPNQIDPQLQQQQYNQIQFNSVQIPSMPQGNTVPVGPAGVAQVQGPPGTIVPGPGGQGYVNNGKQAAQNNKFSAGQPQGPQQQQPQLQGNQQQQQLQQLGLQQQNTNQQPNQQNNLQPQQVQSQQQQQQQQQQPIVGQGYSPNLIQNAQQGKSYNVGAKNGENNSPRNSNMNESSSTINEQHNQFFPSNKQQTLNASVTQTPTQEYPPSQGPSHHIPPQGYPHHMYQKNQNYPADPNNPQMIQQPQQPPFMSKGQYSNTYQSHQQQYPYQAIDPNIPQQHQMMQQGPYNNVPPQQNQAPVNRQISQTKIMEDQMQSIQQNQQQNPQFQPQQWMGQQRGNPQGPKQNQQMMNPNYFNPQAQQQNIVKNGYQQQNSTNNIENNDMNNSSYFNQQIGEQPKLEDQTQRPNDSMSNLDQQQQQYLGNSNSQQLKKTQLNLGGGRQIPIEQHQNAINMYDNNANPENMQDANGEIRNRHNNSQELKKQDQGQQGGGAQVVKWTPNQSGLNQDEDLCLIKEVFSKSNSYDQEMQRQITSEVQKFKQNNQNLTIKAIRSQDEPSFKLEIKDKKRKDFKELVLMVCPRKDSPYEITDCKNLWSLNKQKIPKTNSLMDIIKFWWKFEFQTIEDEKKQNSNNNSGGMHNQHQQMPLNNMNNMALQNNINQY
ncbi:hypothetical protein TTHERM_00812640 (macronuclear) [Tetrahymena thermophila SB210]|uniref:Uncharacterized protein n=1 Tax=Tetrahymena thermophila (strain SB210) TaxID=312017 RepID=Q22SW7_TETTS|nr:hypothetical protein TTHERM_00812640 [Tetrahymena thermophila SB210]EAR88347.3 hypothetical protein TTHERM_00812640 [Tetrahymena thermophila SB210]|eukprot:XP_001008592.3 hypothetical protein TTHERM_00812640 [Tetrahymena thermophila SB210]